MTKGTGGGATAEKRRGDRGGGGRETGEKVN